MCGGLPFVIAFSIICLHGFTLPAVQFSYALNLSGSQKIASFCHAVESVIKIRMFI